MCRATACLRSRLGSGLDVEWPFGPRGCGGAARRANGAVILRQAQDERSGPRLASGVAARPAAGGVWFDPEVTGDQVTSDRHRTLASMA